MDDRELAEKMANAMLQMAQASNILTQAVYELREAVVILTAQVAQSGRRANVAPGE